MIFSIYSLSTSSTAIHNFLFKSFSTVSSPFNWVINKTSNTLSNTWSNIVNFKRQLEKMEEIRQLIKNNQKMLTDNKDLIDENKRLRKLLDYKNLSSSNILFEEASYSTQSGDIIIRDQQYKTLIVDKGSSHGIKPNMPVIAFQIIKNKDNTDSLEKIIVGKVTQVTYLSSKILTITDPDCLVHVKLRPTKTRDVTYTGFLQGRGKYEKNLLLTHIDNIAQVDIGEEVISSGGQSIFPKGIKIGRIIKNISSKADYTKKFIVAPYVNFSQLETIFIIKKNLPEDLEILLGKESSKQFEIIQYIYKKEYQKAMQLLKNLKEKKQ